MAATISVTGDLRFGGNISASITPPNRYDGGLWVRFDIMSDAGPALQAGYAKVDMNTWTAGPMPLGPTPSWSGPVPANGTAKLIVMNGYRRDRTVAETTFDISL